MSPEIYLKNCKVHIWSGKYAVLKTRHIPSNFVAVIKDHNETSVVINQRHLENIDHEGIEKNWKILTFEAVLPFELVGFLAMVSKVLAAVNVSIFALSSFSTDHIMIKEDKLEIAKKALMNLNCIFE